MTLAPAVEELAGDLSSAAATIAGGSFAKHPIEGGVLQEAYKIGVPLGTARLNP